MNSLGDSNYYKTEASGDPGTTDYCNQYPVTPSGTETGCNDIQGCISYGQDKAGAATCVANPCMTVNCGQEVSGNSQLLGGLLGDATDNNSACWSDNAGGIPGADGKWIYNPFCTNRDIVPGADHCNPQGQAGYDAGKAFFDGIASMIACGWMVSHPWEDDSNDPNKTPNPVAKSVASYNAMTQMWPLMMAQYEGEILEKLQQEQFQSQALLSDMITMEQIISNAGIQQNKLSIMFSNIVLFLLLVFFLIKK